MAETIRIEKVKAGVGRPRSYEETEHIYETCSQDRWSTNNNEYPEELDCATAREHEEPFQTSKKKLDDKDNRRSSGYHSGSNRESDCSWNRPFGNRGKYIIITIINISFVVTVNLVVKLLRSHSSQSLLIFCITALTRIAIRSRISSECYQLVNRIEHSIVFASSNLIGTLGSPEFAQQGQVF